VVGVVFLLGAGLGMPGVRLPDLSTGATFSLLPSTESVIENKSINDRILSKCKA